MSWGKMQTDYYNISYISIIFGLEFDFLSLGVHGDSSCTGLGVLGLWGQDLDYVRIEGSAEHRYYQFVVAGINIDLLEERDLNMYEY